MRLQSFLAAGLALLIAPVWAQAPRFPENGKTIRMIVPFAAGGGVDNAARLLSEQLRKQLGVTVIVDNRAGANGTVGGKAVQIAPADGYTLLFSASTHVLARQVMSSPPYDPQADFAPVARVGEAPLMLVISPQLPQDKLTDVLAAARQQPEKWMAAIPAAGAASHLATLLLAKQGNVKFTYVPYKGTQPALADVAGGHVNLQFDSMISLLPLAKAGKVKAIAISTRMRSELAPEVPTVHEAGVPNFNFVTWYGVWAPKDTPPDRVTALHAAINTAVAELGKSGALAKLGVDPVTETIEQFKRYVANDVAQNTELLKSAGFRPE
ncbi:Bug family tripartite tricarboxylate transporter substrate binding protein [Azohydromonas aeria]|uniref:Bug family tripartite tricarboxylate transporter substrate binding protein n=1 Tax=Azohydromonas aeria TaxID=2590212 RepID=UPI0012FA8523|nr:tripartite tricarboxylate transporter substrate binding protein [Azohydromonas aeria]